MSDSISFTQKTPVHATETKQQKRKRKTKRCMCCKKRIRGSPHVLLISNLCKCGRLFCNVHLHQHSCTYNFQEDQQELLINQNPVVVPKVVQKI